MERFELPSAVLETDMLPLHHTRVFLVAGPGLEPGTSAYETDEIAFSAHPAIYIFFSDPDRIRTCDSHIKSMVL